MSRSILVLALLIPLSYCYNATSDSLTWDFLDKIEIYGDELTMYVHDILDVSGSLIYGGGIEHSIAGEIHTLGRMAENYHWHIRDLIAVYHVIQNASDRQAIKDLLNISREFVVEGLVYLDGRINTTLTRSNNMYLITKASQLKDKIAELAIELRDFEF